MSYCLVDNVHLGCLIDISHLTWLTQIWLSHLQYVFLILQSASPSCSASLLSFFPIQPFWILSRTILVEALLHVGMLLWDFYTAGFFSLFKSQRKSLSHHLISKLPDNYSCKSILFFYLSYLLIWFAKACSPI